MNCSIRIARLALITSVLALPLASVASAQEQSYAYAPAGHYAPATRQAITPQPGAFAGKFSSQEAARAAHPIAQGGTTGGTINPGINGDNQQHGYNGG
jgi:hypothetical protein